MTVFRAFLKWLESDFIWISREMRCNSSPRKNSGRFRGGSGEGFKPQNTRNEMRNAVFYKSASGSGVGHRGLTRNLPPVAPIPRHAIANRRRECRLGDGRE